MGRISLLFALLDRCASIGGYPHLPGGSKPTLTGSQTTVVFMPTNVGRTTVVTEERVVHCHPLCVRTALQEDMQRLFLVIKNGRDRAIIAVAHHHGLRASEVSMLQRTDLDMKAGGITINRVKGSISGTYSMSSDTVKLVRSYLKGGKDASP